MSYARVENGSVVKYPYDMPRLRKDNPNISFPRDAFSREEVRTEFNIVEVSEVERPSDLEHHVYDRVPVLVDGTWTQVWEQIPKSAEELEQNVIGERKGEYGPLAEQIEFITENGLEAWQARVAEIKAKYPKA